MPRNGTEMASLWYLLIHCRISQLPYLRSDSETHVF